MHAYLKQSRQLLKPKDLVCIVICNETCDLDSAVCAISLAYYYQSHQMQPLPTKAKNFLPVLNIPRRDYPLKTEVTFLFKEHKIDEKDLTFRDEIKDDFIAKNDVILVDHHVSPMAKRVVEVYDHRPLDEKNGLSINCRINRELVGSCATLVASSVLNRQSDTSNADQYKTMFSLLRSTIILDTINFSDEAGRATEKDLQICDALENILGSYGAVQEPRTAHFQKLVKARADFSALSSTQLLRKDLKILSNGDGKTRMALAGMHMLVQTFIERPDAAEAVETFAKENKCAVVMLIGIFVPQTTEFGDKLERDIGLINIGRKDLLEEVCKCLLAATNPELALQPLTDCKFMSGSFFKQGNVKVTRKHILPIVRTIMDGWTRV